MTRRNFVYFVNFGIKNTSIRLNPNQNLKIHLIHYYARFMASLQFSVHSVKRYSNTVSTAITVSNVVEEQSPFPSLLLTTPTFVRLRCLMNAEYICRHDDYCCCQLCLTVSSAFVVIVKI